MAHTYLLTWVDGHYDVLTQEAARRFQMLYASDILLPWRYGESEETSRVYITSKRKVNELFCDYSGMLEQQFPHTASERTEMDELRLRG